MSVSEVRQQVAAILRANGLHPDQTGEDLRLRFSSAAVILSFIELGTQVVVAMRAPVLSAVGADRDGSVLRELNRRNCAAHFGRWAYYEETQVIAVEYDLLGDDLQDNELLTALAAVARLADEADDALKATLGIGKRAIDHPEQP